MTASFTKDSILETLDLYADKIKFPGLLDDEIVIPSACKMKTFRNRDRWAILIEEVSYSFYDGFVTMVTVMSNFGKSVLEQVRDMEKNQFKFFPISFVPGKELLTIDKLHHEVVDDYLQENMDSILIRGKEIKIRYDKKYYEDRGVKVKDFPKIHGWEYLCALTKDYKSELFASKEELSSCFPYDIELLFELDDWNHPYIFAKAELPSQNETFQLVADALVSNTNFIKPTLKPNTDWEEIWAGGY